MSPRSVPHSGRVMMRRLVKRSSGIAATVAGILLALTLGCGEREAAPRTAEERAARMQALIDAGNEAYSAGDYRLAARRYAAAAVLDKNDPVAYFGMGMALQKLGRDEQARAAYTRARELAKKR
jgi:Tfp pilus assembly protein PilF